MPEIAVVIITVLPQRARQLDQTVRQWRQLGYEPIVLPTPPAVPPSPATHGRMARWALAAASDAQTAIFCEDDVDLDPRLPDALPLIRATGRVVSLYLPGTSHYPARRTPGVLQIAPIVGQHRWFGSQCLVIPGSWCQVVAALPEPAHPATAGFDMVLRDWLAATGQCLYATIPNLAQHRAPPSVTSTRYRPHTSVTYGQAWRLPG